MLPAHSREVVQAAGQSNLEVKVEVWARQKFRITLSKTQGLGPRIQSQDGTKRLKI